jgi:hypothetical protein
VVVGCKYFWPMSGCQFLNSNSAYFFLAILKGLQAGDGNAGQLNVRLFYLRIRLKVDKQILIAIVKG